jgi:WD40 repeat protein
VAFGASRARNLLWVVNGTASVWNIRGRREVGATKLDSGGAVSPVARGSGVALSPDGETVAVNAGAGLTTWRLGERPPRLVSNGYVAFGPDGRTVVTADSSNNILHLRDVIGRRTLGDPVRLLGGVSSALAIDSAGRQVVSGGAHGSIDVAAIEFQRDAPQRLVKPRPDRPLTGHTGTVYGLAFDPRDPNVLASGGSDGTVRLWDVAGRRPIGEPLVAATVVYGVAFSPDGRTLAAAGDDGSVRLWDTATRRSLGEPLQAHEGPTTSVSFSPDGRMLASAGQDATLLLWDSALWSADRATISARMCAIASRNLTRGEWAQFLPDRPYRRTCPQWP